MIKRLISLSCAAALCLTLFTGCSAKEETTTTTAAQTTAAETTAAQAEETKAAETEAETVAEKKDLGKLTVAEFRGMTWAPMYIAYQNGYFEEEGLEIELLRIDDGPNCFKGMHAGQNDICILSQEVALKAEEQGQHSTALVTMLDTRYYAFVATEEIQSVADLKGKTVFASTPGSAPYTFCVAVMEEAGLEIGKDVTLVNLNKGAVVAALEKNEVQAAFINADNFQEADNVDGLHYLVDTRNDEDAAKYLKSEEFPAEVIYAAKEFAAENPEKMQAFVNGVVKGLDWLQNHTSEEAAEVIADLFSPMEKDVIASKIEIMRGAYSKNGYISEAGENAVVDFAKRSGIISTDLKYEDMVDMTYVNNAIEAGYAPAN